MTYPTIARSWIELQIARHPTITAAQLLAHFDEMKALEARNFAETVERKAKEKREAEMLARMQVEAKRQEKSQPRDVGDLL